MQHQFRFLCHWCSVPWEDWPSLRPLICPPFFRPWHHPCHLSFPDATLTKLSWLALSQHICAVCLLACKPKSLSSAIFSTQLPRIIKASLNQRRACSVQCCTKQFGNYYFDDMVHHWFTCAWLDLWFCSFCQPQLSSNGQQPSSFVPQRSVIRSQQWSWRPGLRCLQMVSIDFLVPSTLSTFTSPKPQVLNFQSLQLQWFLASLLWLR